MYTDNILQIINRRLPNSEQTANVLKPATVASEKRPCLHSWWLTQLFYDAGISVVAADDIPMAQLLQNFGESIIDMYMFFTDGRSGINLLTTLQEKVKQIRAMAHDVGILFVSTNPESRINPNLLPKRTWIITSATTPEEIINYLDESRFALSNNSFFIRSLPQFAVTSTYESRENMCFTNRTLPNFNIKHPAMLLPIANVALINNTPVFVEISPQEALVYYDYISSENNIYEKLNKVFRTLKADVDWVKRQTGVQMFLHLDHCNDAEIIRLALDSGFDSIMADGSNHTLSANIRFVQAIKKLTDAYHVPIEGEVGAIDLSGFRKKSTTICAELDIFVEATNVDYVGVNIRQFHGCDYGFDRAREAYLKYMENNQKQNYHAFNLLQSCIDTDGILEEKGYSECSVERVTLKALMDKIIFNTENDLNSIISSFTSRTSISFGHWINEVIQKWHIKQKDMLEENQRLFGDIIGFGMKEDTFDKKNLDFELLASISKSLEGTSTNIVLHGGSSIANDDLCYLENYGVKRINFGSSPYRLFINSLRSEAIGRRNYNDSPLISNPLEASYFINKYASNWKGWLSDKPFFLSDFEHELENQFFRPMLNGSRMWKGV